MATLDILSLAYVYYFIISVSTNSQKKPVLVGRSLLRMYCVVCQAVNLEIPIPKIFIDSSFFQNILLIKIPRTRRGRFPEVSVGCLVSLKGHAV